jgi:uncharacterized protein YdeI (YjbR/CyaY-like superfamily)
MNDKTKDSNDYLVDKEILKPVTFKVQESYQIEFDKVNTIEDVKLILKAIDIRFTEQYGNLKDITHLIKKVDE